MDDMIWISWVVGIFSVILLVLLLRMKKTDPAVDCEKYRKVGCQKISGRDCNFPDCEALEKFRSSHKV
jgi:hypothetical protein